MDYFTSSKVKASAVGMVLIIWAHVCYADDLVLLCPSVKGLHDMLQTCQIYGEMYGMKFNPKKTVCIKFGKDGVIDPNLKLEGETLEWKKYVKHLGNYLNYKLDEEQEIQYKCGDLFGRMNTLEAYLRDAPDRIKLSVFNSKCCHMHGCEAWCFDGKHVGRYWTAWNRCMRILLKLHPATHTVLLPLIGKTISARDQAAKRFIGLIKSMANNPNRRILYITLSSMKDHDSIFGRNVDYVTSRYRISRNDVFRAQKFLQTFSEEEEAIAHGINELRLAKQDILQIDCLNNNEFDVFMNFLCTL